MNIPVANRPYVLIVGEDGVTGPLAETLKSEGIDYLRAADGALAATYVDAAEKQGAPIDVAFLSSELKQAQIEWLLSYMRAKEAFKVSRVIVVGAENKSKIKYWLKLGATSCVGAAVNDVKLTARYWASLLKLSA